MKRHWYCIVFLLIFLAACGKGDGNIPADVPYVLEVESGDSGVVAMNGAYDWISCTEDGETEKSIGEAVDPLTVLSDIPFLNESKEKYLKLLFPVEPDEIKITSWSSADGYTEAAVLESPKLKVTAPDDGSNYLFAVEAQWNGAKKSQGWGNCTYYFRYLPEHATGDQSQVTALYRAVQLKPEELFGVVFLNSLDEQKRSCMSMEDRAAILDYLKNHLTTNFVEIPMPEAEADYVLRLAMIDGTQLTLSYGGEGKNAWLLVDGVPYQAEVMDFYSLWEKLEATPVNLNEEDDGQYLQISKTFPGEAWGEEFVYAYLRSMDGEILYDEILWIEDTEQPNGYALKRGTLGLTQPLSETCEYWILKAHAEPWCQVEREMLWQWSESADWDVLFRLYTKDGEIVAVCEQYLP